ncbi:MAG: starch synthase [Flavobacteriales bacterium]|jgi:starch synthase
MTNKSVLMVASENDAHPGAKVGGVGDVIRDLPANLKNHGLDVSTIIPSYGFLSRIEGIESLAFIDVPFMGHQYRVQLLRSSDPSNAATHYVLHHALFSIHGETVYCHDGDDRPFAKDATKFAFFCAAIAHGMVQEHIPKPDVIHCHDWHSAFLLILIRYSPQFELLTQIKTVFSIHNMAMQGVRPFSGDESSFEKWFPDLAYYPSEICDPLYRDCVNPIRAAIRFASVVHTVSPSYAREILQRSDHAAGIYGGENLQDELAARANDKQLIGILNGCEYPKKKIVKPSKSSFIAQADKDLCQWASASSIMSSAHWLAEKRIASFGKSKKTAFVVSSVGRLTEQKARLLLVDLGSGKTALDQLLLTLGDRGQLILIGSGDKNLEAAVIKVAGRHTNCIFLNGYSAKLADMLYAYGDLFLMPSSFEPCGISQLLAMRSAQPCLVHAVGGLKDTVKNNDNGFSFEASGLEAQARAMVNLFSELLTMKENSPEIWEGIVNKARKTRFSWDTVAQSYLEQLYS